MGFFDRFVELIDNVREAAEAALRVAQRVAEEAQRKILEATERVEQVARSAADRICNTADSMKHDLEELVPSFDDKPQQIIDEVTEVASTAAEEGVDITDAVNAAVELALKKVEDALNAAIDAVNRFLSEANNKIFGFLEGILPEAFQFLLKPVKNAAEWAINGLRSFGDTLKSKISWILNKTKEEVQAFVRKVGEVLSPIWNFVKKLWKLLFGSEPEHCHLVAEWFGDRMKRAEHQLL
jgi:phage-related protein